MKKTTKESTKLENPMTNLNDTRWRSIGMLFPLLVLAGGCASEMADIDQPILEVAENETGIGGTVTTVDGAPIAGATVSIPGMAPLMTDDSGAFSVTGLSPTERLPVTIDAQGYGSTVRIYSVAEGQVRSLRIPLQEQERPVFFHAEEGATLSLPGGSTLTIAPNSLVTGEGTPAEGTVRAERVLWEATNPAILAAAPGDYTVIQPDGTSALLQSFGMFRVRLFNEAGERLEFNRGQPGRLEIPVSEQFEGLPLDQVGLFSFNTDDGTWVQEQVLTVNSSGTALIGSLQATDPDRNIDMPQETTCLIFPVERYSSPNFVPAVGASVTAQGMNYNGSSTGFSDANGNVCLNVRTNSHVEITAFWTSGGSTWVLPWPFYTVNPTPSTTGRCDLGGCVEIDDPLMLDLILGGGRAPGSR
jgi:hypothetical protein